MRFLYVLAVSAAMVIAGCAPPTPKEYVARGQRYQEEAQKNPARPKRELDSLNTLALQSYVDLLKHHPKSVEAEQAQFMIAAIQHNDLQQYDNAVASYKKYYADYAGSKRAPMALFLSGYLYANELRNMDSAKAMYQKFLERFPNDEMAMSAKFELDNLGKSPEELLPQAPAEEPRKAKVAAKKSTRR